MKLAFAKNIYSDNLSQVVFTDDINIKLLKDNLGRMEEFTLGVPESIINLHKNDTINQLCIFINEGILQKYDQFEVATTLKELVRRHLSIYSMIDFRVNLNPMI